MMVLVVVKGNGVARGTGWLGSEPSHPAQLDHYFFFNVMPRTLAASSAFMTDSGCFFSS